MITWLDSLYLNHQASTYAYTNIVSYASMPTQLVSYAYAYKYVAIYIILHT